jgi:transcriptional regulator with XRE-family HTH domain
MKVKLCLKEIAQAKRLTISDIQRKSGLTMGLVRRYWYNETTSVKLEALGLLATLLHVKPNELISEGDSEENL